MHALVRRLQGVLTLITRFGPRAAIRVALASRRAKWAATPGELVELRIPEFAHPFWVRAGTTDIRVFDQVVVYRELEAARTLSPHVVVDGGANIGLSALVFANWWPAARVLCVEVDDGNLALLRRNVAPYPNIEVIAAGLWSHATRLRITNSDAEPWAFQVVEDVGGSIAAMGIADLLRNNGIQFIDLLKLDIEGAELAVLQTAAAWIDRVGVLMVEPHDRTHPGSSDALRGALRGQPFVLSRSGEYTVATRKPR